MADEQLNSRLLFWKLLRRPAQLAFQPALNVSRFEWIASLAIEALPDATWHGFIKPLTHRFPTLGADWYRVHLRHVEKSSVDKTGDQGKQKCLIVPISTWATDDFEHFLRMLILLTRACVRNSFHQLANF